MHGKFKVAIAMVGSFTLVAILVPSLHAQATLPAYVVAEIDVKNREKFDTEFLPPAIKAVEDAGGSYVARGGRTLALERSPPQSRIVVVRFGSLGKVQAWWNSPARKQVDAIGQKYGSFRVYAVESTSQ